MASGAIPMDQVEAGVSGSLVLVAGGAMLVMGCFSLVEGILSRRAAKDPSKAQPAFVFAIISLVLAAINLTSWLFQRSDRESELSGSLHEIRPR